MNRRFVSLRTKLAFFALLLVVFVAGSLSYYIREGQKKAIVENLQINQMDSVRRWHRWRGKRSWSTTKRTWSIM
jgi:hypothetical protein